MATETLQIQLDAEQMKSIVDDAIRKVKNEMGAFDRLILEVRDHAAQRAEDELNDSLQSVRLDALSFHGCLSVRPSYNEQDRARFIKIRQQQAVDRLMGALHKIAAGDE